MRAVVQRVVHASVTVDGEVVGAIGPGLLVLLGVGRDDDTDTARALAAKIHTLRILRGERSLGDGPAEGDDEAGSGATPLPAVLAVSQFTLLADTRKGRRPSWSAAAPGDIARPVFEQFVRELRERGTPVETGVFGADMRVELANDGPVTLVLDA